MLLNRANSKNGNAAIPFYSCNGCIYVPRLVAVDYIFHLEISLRHRYLAQMLPHPPWLISVSEGGGSEMLVSLTPHVPDCLHWSQAVFYSAKNLAQLFMNESVSKWSYILRQPFFRNYLIWQFSEGCLNSECSLSQDSCTTRSVCYQLCHHCLHLHCVKSSFSLPRKVKYLLKCNKLKW